MMLRDHMTADLRAATLADLARMAPPCGMLEEGGEYINDCHPGYAHKDHRPNYVEYGDFVVTGSDVPPEDFDSYYT